ncbi:MAG: phage tail tape measure protein, partial [Rikenellaceae bacterium]|nr:phage tail tape measure protein [Rikenellaceae bacterium]
MAGNNVTIDAKLNEKGVVSGAKQIKVSLEEIKKADGSLNWSGVKEGESAAKKSGDGFTVLKGILANLATAGIAAAAGAVKNFCSEVVQIGQTFETSMSKVSALSGATGDELAALEAKARELGASTTFSASQAADALGYMALAGWDTEQMLEGVGSVLTLAQAGEMDLAAASDLVTDYLSAFNMEASETARMVDVLAFALANANTTVEGLGMAFKNCAANANAAGMDVETTSAAISMMANQGLKGSEAGTALNAVLRDMTAKMEDGAIAIGEQSVAVMDAQGNYRDFTEILADVQAATDGMGEAEKAAALQSTFTADSIKGLNLMLNAGADE